MAELQIEAIRNGAKHRVFASNGSTIHGDLITLAKAEDRTKFVDAVVKAAPAIDPKAVEKELLRLAAEDARRPEGREAAGAEEAKTPEALLAEMPDFARQDAERMLRQQNMIETIQQDIAALGVAGESQIAMTVYLIGTSRLLKNPLAAIVQGPTSSGKSFIYESTSRLFPPEAVIHAKQMTPQALFHMKPGALAHKWIVAGERSRVEDNETGEASRALREMLASGKLSKLMPVKKGNAIETVLIEQEGPIAYIESTTLSKIFEEDANRCVLLQTDEREAQTRRIISTIARNRMKGHSPTVENIIQRHIAAQRMLRSVPVIIPFAEQLADKFPAARTEARRAFGHLMNMVEAVALLHQCQRQVIDGKLIAIQQDYALAKLLLDLPMAALFGRQMSPAAERFLERIAKEFQTEEFTTTEAIKKGDASDHAVRGWLNELADAGRVECLVPGKGRIPSRWKNTDTQPEARKGGLPELEVI